ncbi:hypothetical protein ACH5RR_000011 [Cinchona calisaya]|uniref:Protein kinase domain-containing protein n=1 Tax=Cinchona calisaya TaxID=153742 RepID=A0ABD3AZX2_9GENT
MFQFLQNFKSWSCFFTFLALVVLLLDNHIGVLVTFCEQDDTPFLQRNDESHWPGGENESERCGSFQIPFPFCLTNNNNTSSSSCKWSGSFSDPFRLSCLNSTSLYLIVASQSYRVLYFFPDGILVDFPNNSTDLNSFSFAGDEYFGISTDNLVALYDCQDSSSCKIDCGKSFDDGGAAAAGYPACCYPLSDLSAWRPGGEGNDFSVFPRFRCKGFSSWVVLPGSRRVMRGVKLEWAIPRNSTQATCARHADAINATSVKAGMRCQCRDGFIGDGFASGFGCFKCFLTSAFTIAFLVALVCLLKRQPIKSSRYELDDESCGQNTISIRKACRTRLFAYHELEEATKGFENGQKLSDCIKGALYAGILADGSRILVQSVQCESESELIQVLSRVEALSVVSHKNMAQLLGWSVDSVYSLLVVYEYPAIGTLEQQLFQTGRHQKTSTGLDWFKRLNIVAETTSFLAFLQCEISPPIFHYDLQSSCILLDEEFSTKIFGFEHLNSSNLEEDCHPRITPDGSYNKRHDVYNLGLILLEVITGTKSSDIPTAALQKIRNGKLEEVVDPFLYYHEEPPYRREQIKRVADLATKCLLFGVDGKLGMTDVARELVHMTKESVGGSSRRCCALEETFSNSSLLQMISMSPDSLMS